MSMCAVNMQKRTMGDLGGVQSHNQREHESRKNREIDYSKSHLNYDLIHEENVSYRQLVKERIDSLELKRAVRKDAVVYCAFIVGSDREFFDLLAYKEHCRRENMKEAVAIGIRPPAPFECMDEEYREDCKQAATQGYFRDATEFFQRHFGKENVVNATVHLDEPQGAPHLHLGLVPVTSDGRLSAKSLFTPTSLRQLQTNFAAEVGAKYGLERGREGSEAKHLDEVTFKLQKRSEELQNASQELQEARSVLWAVKGEVEGLRAEKAALTASVTALNEERAELASDLEHTKSEISEAKDELEAVMAAVKRGNSAGAQMYGDEWERRISAARERATQTNRLRLLEKFVALPQIKPLWEQFCALMERGRGKKRNEMNRG